MKTSANFCGTYLWKHKEMLVVGTMSRHEYETYQIKMEFPCLMTTDGSIDSMCDEVINKKCVATLGLNDR